jgi:hypothetical protein
MIMAGAHKSQENSVTDEIIRRVHLTLADLKTGEEMLSFLRSTEPIFMEEVNRFIQTEMSRMRYQVTESQATYMGSVIGACYIAGFLIAREAAHQMFDGQFDFKSDIKRALSTEEIDKIIDKKRKEGSSYKEIAKVIRNMIKKNTKTSKPSKKLIVPPRNRGERLDIGDLE